MIRDKARRVLTLTLACWPGSCVPPPPWPRLPLACRSTACFDRCAPCSRPPIDHRAPDLGTHDARGQVVAETTGITLAGSLLSYATAYAYDAAGPFSLTCCPPSAPV